MLTHVAEPEAVTREVTTPTKDEGIHEPKKSKWEGLCNEYEDVFKSLSDLPPPDRVTHSIDLIDESAPPPKPRTYRMSPAELAEVRR